MRTHVGRIATPIAASIGLALGSCAYVSHEEQAPTCADDASLCPSSSRTATGVTCDCTCTVGMLMDERTFRGRVKACLPSELNAAIASTEQRTALASMGASDFDQRVFRYCSQSVAGFLQGVIRTQGRSFIACGVPLSCECTTAGAFLDSGACRSPCADVACTERTCPDVLYTTVLDMGWCGCSRASACAASSPAPEEPPICLASNGFAR